MPLMSNTKRNSVDSNNAANEGEPNSGNGTATGANPDNGLRDFLYLDYPKLNSYFAQISSGLPTKQEHLTTDTRGTTVSNPSVALRILGQARASAATDGVMERLVGELQGEASGQLESSIDFTKRQDHEADEERLIITSELHHAVFTLVLDYLERQELVGDGSKETYSRPFQRLEGTAEIIDFSQLAAGIKDFPKVGALFHTITGQPDFSTSMNHPAELSEMVAHYYGDKIGVAVFHHGSIATTYLDAAHLTAPMSQIRDNFGIITQIPLTLFGLQVGGAYPKAETDGEPRSEDDPLVPPLTAKGLGAMAEGILTSSRGMEAMSRFFRLRGTPHIYPIAVYVDF